jgi:hypothetical protein
MGDKRASDTVAGINKPRVGILRETANTLIAKAMATSFCPLSMVGNQDWKEVFTYFAPGYELPNHQNMTEKYTPMVKKRIKSIR